MTLHCHTLPSGSDTLFRVGAGGEATLPVVAWLSVIVIRQKTLDATLATR